jgi:single-strand DNA-binding protein
MKQLLIEGHIGYDAVIKEGNGKQFVAFSVAVNEKYKNGQGTEVETTDWVSCTTTHLKIAQYLKKGTRVMVQGKPVFKIFQDKQRQTKCGVDIQAHNIQLLSSPKKEEDPLVSALTNFLNQYKSSAQA